LKIIIRDIIAAFHCLSGSANNQRQHHQRMLRATLTAARNTLAEQHTSGFSGIPAFSPPFAALKGFLRV
jgi:hypothetical protein